MYETIKLKDIYANFYGIGKPLPPEKISNCCESNIIENTDICLKCEEHCQPISKDENEH